MLYLLPARSPQLTETCTDHTSPHKEEQTGKSKDCDSVTAVCWCTLSYSFIPTKRGLVSDFRLDLSTALLFLKCVGVLSLILGPFVQGRKRSGVKRANRSFKPLQRPLTGPPPPRQPCLHTQPWWSPLNSCKSNCECPKHRPEPTCMATYHDTWGIVLCPQPTRYIYAFSKFMEHHLIPCHQVAKRRPRPIPALRNSWTNRATIIFQWRSQPWGQWVMERRPPNSSWRIMESCQE